MVADDVTKTYLNNIVLEVKASKLQGGEEGCVLECGVDWGRGGSFRHIGS